MVYRNKPSEQEARQEMCFGLVCFSLLSFLTFRARPTLSNLVSQTLACTRAKILDELKIRPSLERPVCSVLLFFFFFRFPPLWLQYCFKFFSRVPRANSCVENAECLIIVFIYWPISWKKLIDCNEPVKTPSCSCFWSPRLFTPSNFQKKYTWLQSLIWMKLLNEFSCCVAK